MLHPLADEEQVDDAFTITGGKISDCHLKSYGSVAGRVAVAMNCWGEEVRSTVLDGCFVVMSLVILHVLSSKGKSLSISEVPIVPHYTPPFSAIQTLECRCSQGLP